MDHKNVQKMMANALAEFKSHTLGKHFYGTKRLLCDFVM
jgi:uncharacterized protein (DUF2164 family)